MKLLMIDNYDSFTYNLVHYFAELSADVTVVRNDQTDLASVAAMQPDCICISPGPCTPDKAGISLNLLQHFSGQIPILGVCLGHQAIGMAFGGKIVPAKKIMHGKTSTISHDGSALFAGIDSPFTAIRYHSLAVAKDSLPECLQITATSDDGEIMALAHKSLPVFGVQFHPESIMSEHGYALLQNFLSLVPAKHE